MQEVKDLIEKNAHGESYTSFNSVYRVGVKSSVRYWVLGIFAALFIILFLPWTQNIRTKGSITTLNQEDRPQQLNSIIPGRIVKWYVNEGDFVTNNQLIAEVESGEFYQELRSRYEGKIKFLIQEGQFGQENDGACMFE